MEKGVPCISTVEGGIQDIIENCITGFVTPRQDASSTAEAIEKLIINPGLRTQMGQSALQRFEKLFTEEQFEKTMKDCLKQSM